MKLVELTREGFDLFAQNHKYASFYQTSSFGLLMSKQGFEDFYLGLADDSGTVLCASLFMRESKKSVLGTLSYAYAPRGFLIDYSNVELLNIYTKELKKFLSKKGIAFVRIDPPIIYKEHDKKGNIKKGGIDNSNTIATLQSLGYEHLGFNNYFEALKPRWNAILKFSGTSKKLFALISKEMRNKVRKAQKLGLEVVESDRNSITQFYKFVEDKHIRKLEYYRDFYDIFNKNDMFHIYFAKLNPVIYLQNSKKLFEKESANNAKLVAKMTKNRYQSNETLINKKMDSDRLLNNFKNDIIKATEFMAQYPNGILIGSNAVVTYKQEVYFLIDGYDHDYHDLPANHLLKWKIMENYANKGYNSFHLNGITGDFSRENKFYGLYTFKMGFNADVIEYIGEFDLVINGALYKMYSSVPQLQQYLKK